MDGFRPRRRLQRLWHGSVVVLLLAASCDARGSRPSVGALASKVPLACPVPLEEEKPVDETIAGLELFSYMDELLVLLPGMLVRHMCKPLCLEVMKDAGIATQIACAMNCIKKAETAPTSGQECMTAEEAAERCAPTTVNGTFCVRIPRDGKVCIFLDYDDVKQQTTTKPLALDCPPGFWCEGGAEHPRVCRKGHYCPRASSSQGSCVDGNFCLLPGNPITCNVSSNETAISTGFGKLLPGVQCTADEYGQIVFPDPCEAGYYCEGGKPTLCPEHFKCPGGTRKPIPCQLLEICPEGTSVPFRWPRAALEFVCAVVSTVLCCWILGTLTARRTWMIMVLILGLWGWEVGRGIVLHTDFLHAHAVFLTIDLTVVIYATCISPIVASLLKITIRFPFVLEFFGSLVAVCVLTALNIIDAYAACFMLLFWPGLAVSAVLQGSSFRMLRVQAVSLVLLQAVCILLPWAMGSQDPLHTTAVAAFIGLLLLPELGSLFLGVLRTSREDRQRVQMITEASEQSTAAKKLSWTHGFGIPLVEASMTQTPGEYELGHQRRAASYTGPDSSHRVSRRSPTRDRWSDGSLPVEDLQRSAMLSRTQPSDSATGSAPERSAVDMEREIVDTPSSIGLTLKDLSLFLPDGRAILSNISLTIPACETAAVMGPSGSGKTSITNVLSGRAGYGIVTGDIIVNGDPRGVRLRDLERVVGFVPQDDVMHRTLTVRENVRFQAELRLPYHVRHRPDGTDATDFGVEQVLKKMGLDHVGDTIIGDEHVRGISGGQRKRVSIGMELIAKPALLFLDEPTSGLDSTTSHEVVRIITEMARQEQCTSIAVIHQPRYETLMLFDNLVLLATGGFLVYAGPTGKAMEYFQKELGVTFPPLGNPADIFMDAITLVSAQNMAKDGSFKSLATAEAAAALGSTKAFGEFLAKKWSEAAFRYGPPETSALAPLPDLDPLRALWGESLLVQLKRAAIQQRRTWVQAALLNAGLIFGMLAITAGLRDFFEQLATCLCFMMLMQGIVAQRVFGGVERVVAWRESGVGVNMVIYFVGRDFAALLEIYLGSAIFAVFYWPMSTMQNSFHSLVWTMFAFNYAVWGLGFIYSVVFEPSSAQMLCVVSSFIAFLVMGLTPPFITLLEISYGIMSLVMALSPIRWCFAHILMAHVEAESELSNPMLRFFLKDDMFALGLPINWMMENGLTCNTRPAKATIDRWVGCEGLNPPYRARRSTCDINDDRPPDGMTCTQRGLYLIGLYYRLLAMILLVVTAREKWQGGQSTSKLARLCKKLSTTLLLVVTNFQVVNLLNTNFIT